MREMMVLPLTAEKPQTDAQNKVKILMWGGHYSMNREMKEWWAGKERHFSWDLQK